MGLKDLGLRVGGALRDFDEHWDAYEVGTDRTCGPNDYEIEVLGPRFRETDILFGLFRCVSAESVTKIVNQLSILFQKYGLRCSGRAVEDHAPPKIPF